MSQLLRDTFKRCKNENRNALVNFVTAGFPTVEDTVDILLGMQEGGVDVIELGIPFSDPMAEGPTIQEASAVALENGVTVAKCIDVVKQARAASLSVPIIFMGYYKN